MQPRIHLVYKVSCPLTKCYYIGVHSTNEINDGYAGSGNWPIEYRQKHGNILKREIINTYDTREAAVLAERQLVTKELIETDSLCMNLTIGGNAPPDHVNQGLTKETSAGRRAMAAKLTGRTKESHDYIRFIAEKTSTRLKGTSKETHAGVAKMTVTLTGRSKETHLGVALQAAKLTGRTKESHPGIAAQSLKMRKLTHEQHMQIFKLHQVGKMFKDIQVELKLEHISYNAIVVANRRVIEQENSTSNGTS